MENSMDKATLEYMTNPQYHFLQKNTDVRYSQEAFHQFSIDKKFYRKRILSLTRDMFKKNTLSANLNEIHNQYISHIIDHLKLDDRKDILQEEYDGIEIEKKEDNNINYSLAEANKEIFNIKQHPPTLDNYVKITKIKTEKKIIPKRRNVNLKQPQLKTKGLREKKDKK